MKRVVVVGSGIAGLGAAWTLRDVAEVVVLEAGSHIGGHADTVDVPTGSGTIPVDMGFIVYNDLTYPHMIRLFDEIGVPVTDSDMSFALSSPEFEYSGDAVGLFGGLNWSRPDSYRLLKAILRFRDVAREHLDDPRTIGHFVDDLDFPPVFRDRYLLPMAAAIWSSPHIDAADIPAGTLLRFFDQHRLLDITGRPTWRTVSGGSREYVRRLVDAAGAPVITDAPVTAVDRHAESVTVHTRSGDAYEADHVVFACHADTTIGILGEGATDDERKVLGAFQFSNNHAVMHSDRRLMPRARRTWSAWNVLETEPGEPVTVTYWMNRLQPLSTDQDIFVTLNPPFRPDLIHRTAWYSHPVFDPDAIAAQVRLPDIQGAQRTWFCGAWSGYGFHEDGLESGMAVGRALGGSVPWWNDVDPDSQAARIADGVTTAR
jgi:predicted NAD/FAD-binding protein